MGIDALVDPHLLEKQNPEYLHLAWYFNYNRIACQTMFTLFFGGVTPSLLDANGGRLGSLIFPMIKEFLSASPLDHSVTYSLYKGGSFVNATNVTAMRA
jgi:hypothetical protein